MTAMGDAAYSPPTMNRWQHEGAFVVRFSCETDPKTGRFCGRIEHVASGEMMRFQSLDELAGFLLEILRRTSGEAEEPGTRVKSVTLRNTAIDENRGKPSGPESHRLQDHSLMKQSRVARTGDVMKQNGSHNVKGDYVLATGGAAANRLRILHSIYGPGARRVLEQAGIQPGMKVADLGCGVGMVTQLLAELVGPTGQVVGVDFSAAQIEQARTLLPAHLTNVSFVEASATDTGLPRSSFDLVYSRFLLIHLTEPEAALREMHQLLKPNGILVCEDGDLTSAGSEPPSQLEAFSNFFGQLGPKWGVDYTLGRRLYRMVLAANFSRPEIILNQPVFAQGENKRLLELSVAEAGPAFVAAGVTTSAELQQTLIEMRRLADDETVLAVMPRMSQVWARKPGSAIEQRSS
jgi:SAM-dependent methyltransferase